MTNREIDLLVAKHVMGLDYQIICGHYGPFGEVRTRETPCDQVLGEVKFKGECPRCGWKGEVSKVLLDYSTHIWAAWKVVEKLKDARFSIRNNFCKFLQEEVSKEKGLNEEYLISLSIIIFFLTPKAICLSALRAIKVMA